MDALQGITKRCLFLLLDIWPERVQYVIESMWNTLGGFSYVHASPVVALIFRCLQRLGRPNVGYIQSWLRCQHSPTGI